MHMLARAMQKGYCIPEFCCVTRNIHVIYVMSTLILVSFENDAGRHKKNTKKQRAREGHMCM
jgi:hypothetical protein